MDHLEKAMNILAMQGRWTWASLWERVDGSNKKVHCEAASDTRNDHEETESLAEMVRKDGYNLQVKMRLTQLS